MKTTGTLNAGNLFHSLNAVMNITEETTAREVSAFIKNNSCCMRDCTCGRNFVRINRGDGWEGFYDAAYDNGELGIDGLRDN